MNSVEVSKPRIKIKSFGNIALFSFAVVLVAPMLYQCISLCIDYYNQLVTINIYIQDVDQSSFLPKLQFCFEEGNNMNFTRAQSMGLNESHQYYLKSYFHSPQQVQLIPAGLFDDLTNETSLENYMQRAFGAWDEIEYDIVRIAERVINSSNLMEFWNLNQPNNLASVRFADGNMNSSAIVGPYIDQDSWQICYDIPSSPVPNFNDYVQFKFSVSVNRANALGSNSFAYFSAYIGDAVVFDGDEQVPISYIKDSTKYLTRLRNWFIISARKWIALNKRNSGCLEDEDDKMLSMTRCPFGYNVGYCEFQCVQDYYWRNFNCVLNGTNANRCHRLKTLRMLFEKYHANLSSYAAIMPANAFSALESSFYGFSTGKNKMQALMKFIETLSEGHKLFAVENCKRQCSIQKALPFCNSWEILFEKTYSKEDLHDIGNTSKPDVHDVNVHLTFKIKRSMLIYEQVLKLSLENFVGQLGGLIGLYIGWSFLSVGMFFLLKLTNFIERPSAAGSEVALSRKQVEDMINIRIEAIEKGIDETKSKYHHYW